MQDAHIFALCHVYDNRRRSLRQWVAHRANDDGEVTMKDGATLRPPDGDAIAPGWPGPQRHHLRPRSSVPLNPGSSGDSLLVPNTQRPESALPADRDGGFMRRQCETSREPVTTHKRPIRWDLRGAVDNAMTHWPDLKDLFAMGHFKTTFPTTCSSRILPPILPILGLKMLTPFQGP